MQVEKVKRVLLLCPYPEGVAPGQRLKYEQYFDFLRREGFEVVVSPFFSLRAWKILYRKGYFLSKAVGVAAGYWRRCFDLLRTPFYDGTYVFLHATPFGGAFFERLFRKLSKRLVYDIDDLVYLGRVSEFNRISGIFKSPKKYSYLMRNADHVITCTPYLDDYVRKFNSRTTDISSTIKTNLYLPKNRYKNDRVPVIGWSGSHSTVAYLRLLEPVLQKVAQTHAFKLKVIGSASFRIPGIEVEASEWKESSEVADLQEIDIGLYPLPTEEWVLGKSGLKALQYMALGIPTVATAIGANYRVMEHGSSGFLVQSEAEWITHLTSLLDNPELRKKVGQAARERVVKLYSVRSNEKNYLRVFDSVFSAER